MSREQVRTSLEAAQDVARAVADGASQTANRAVSAARQASDGVTEFRAVIRRQPITMAFVMLAMGYLLGSHLTHDRN